MTLKKVVFPAPFGPISAVIEPSFTLIVAPSTARMPPNRLTTSSATKITPSRSARASEAGATAVSVTEHHLLPLPERALGPERHQQDEDQPDDHEPQGRDAGLRNRQLEEPQALEQRPQDDRPDRHAPVVRQPAEHQHRVAKEGHDRHELLRPEELQVEREEEARQRPQRGGDRQRLQLVGERVLAQRPGRVLILADGAKDASPGCLLDAVESKREQKRNRPDDQEEGKQR